MYGGNSKSLHQVAQEVKTTVLGQDNTVDKLCAFVDMASTRAKLIEEGYEDSLGLPPLSAALIVGPTASGKSHMLKTFADKADMLYRTIDASSMSAEDTEVQALAPSGTSSRRSSSQTPGRWL